MFRDFFRFETRFRFKSLMFWVFFALFFGLTALVAGWDDATMPGAGGKVARNSPYAITLFFLVSTQIGVFVAAAFVASSVCRDSKHKIDSLFYAAPIRRHGYLAGRFAGSLVAAVAVTVAAAIGHALGCIPPLHPPEKLVTFSVGPYLEALVVFVIPNFFVLGALSFAVGTLTRKSYLAHVALVCVLVFLGISQNFLSDLEYRWIAALADPFGGTAWFYSTQYWTVAEKNSMTGVFESNVLQNRALWIGIGFAFLALTHARFRAVVGLGGRKKKTTTIDPGPAKAPTTRALPRVTLNFSTSARLRQLAIQFRHELRGIVMRPGFLVLVVIGIVNSGFVIYGSVRQAYGTPVFPVTRLVLEAVSGGFSVFLLAIIVVYAGQCVWREREAGIAQIRDAMPTPTWIALASKLAALLVAVTVLLVFSMATGVVFQLTNGFSAVEFGLFLKGLFLIEFPRWVELAVLAFTVQVLVNNKYLGFGLMVLYFISLGILQSVGVEHNMLLFGQDSGANYSDMNRYGHFTLGFVWFHLYWHCASGILVLISVLFWVRGTDTSFRVRAREARRRVRPWVTASLAVLAALFIGSGAYIYYNTTVLNTFRTSDEQELLQVRFEREYKQYENTPQPRLIGVNLHVDIYPEDRSIHAKGVMALENRTDAPIESLILLISEDIEVVSLSVPESARTIYDKELGFSMYTLPEPLAPGARMDLEFETWRRNPGFVNSGSNINIVQNGTFFHGAEVVPGIGYNRGFEIGDDNKRKEHDLPERERMKDLDDPTGRGDTYISTEADWIDFEVTMSTSADQIAIAPGYLQREWTEGDRRFYHYKMDAPILNLYGFLSARFEVVRDTWNDVSIEVYHHAPHAFNVKKMIGAVQDSLDYYTKHFSPYQHRQVRIIEFPKYRRFAQSLPNTIPYSEGIGFIAKIVDPETIDYVYYVTAHEIAHQWWAHQVIGANVQGSTVLVETMAQYSALMVMEKKYGRDKMRKFLRHELDQYLQGRGRERKKEQPLMRNENQGYIHYNKGSVIMYAMREYIGEETLNAALAQFIEEHKFQRPPFTTAREFVEALRAATPADRAYIIEDWFETITLYDNRATSATYTEQGDGRYKVTLEVSTRKLRADELGEENEVALTEGGEFVEIGVMGKDDEGEETVLYRKQHRLEGSDTSLELIVDQKPVRAGIDPMILLIDRNPEDNVRAVEAAGG